MAERKSFIEGWLEAFEQKPHELKFAIITVAILLGLANVKLPFETRSSVQVIDVTIQQVIGVTVEPEKSDNCPTIASSKSAESTSTTTATQTCPLEAPQPQINPY